MEQIIKLFTDNHIKYIVSVDDCYVETVNDIIESFLLEDMVTNLIVYKSKLDMIQRELNISVLNKLPPHIRESELSKFLSELTVKEKEVLITGDLKVNDTVLKSQKENLLSFFNKLAELKIISDFKIFGTIKEAKKFFDSGVQRKWQPTEEKKVLWLIDREFGGNKNEGFELLDVFSKDSKTWNIGVLATQNINDISSEQMFNSYLEQISEQLGENKNSVWLIEKRLIDIDKSKEFAETITHGLRRNYTYKITNFLTNTLSKGIKEASVEFKNIEQSTINNIILKFSNQEGASIIDTLTRVLLAISKHDLNRKIAINFDEISKLILSYEKLCEEEDFVRKSNLEEVFQFRHKEKYNTLVNSNYFPVGFGDIFIINKQEYILVSQPCDIQIRGEKGERNLQQATLLKITNTLPEYGENAYYTLKYYKRTEIYYVLFRDPLLIDFNILDLCSLNKDGKAVVNIAQLDSPLKTAYRYNYGQRSRLDKVLSKLNDVYKEKKAILDTFEQIQERICTSGIEGKEKLLSYINDYQQRSDSYWNFVININNFNLSNENISFPVERVCRLNEDFTTNIMFRYSTYSSRMGLPGDYGSKLLHTEYEVVAKSPLSYLGQESQLITTDRTLTVLLDEKNDQILQNAFKELIKGNVSKECQRVIEKDPGSYIKINENKKQVIVPGDCLVKRGKELVSFAKGHLNISLKMMEENTPNFYNLIEKILNKEEIIRENRLFMFFNRSKLNENISIKLELFSNKVFELKIEQQLVLTIKLIVTQLEKNFFNIEVKLIEDNANIEIVHQKLNLDLQENPGVYEK